MSKNRNIADLLDANGDVTSANIADSAITSAKINDGTITTDDINASDVTNLKSGRKNFVINGGFDVWQRGTTDSYSTSGGYRSADRVYVNASGGSCKLEQGTFSIDQTDVPGNPTYYGMLDVQTGNDNCGLQFRLEDEKIGANRDMTLSFWAKSSSPRLLYTSLQSFGSTSSVITATQSFTPTSAWTKYTFTFNLGSIATVSGTTKYTRFSINQGSDTSTTAWTLDIAQVQLELGDTATDFEHRSYGEELALCQRYFSKGGTEALIDAYQSAAGFNMVNYYFPVTMRTTPTLQNLNLTSSSNQHTIYPVVYTDSSHDGGKDHFYIVSRASSTGRFYCKLEGWEADAEL